MNQKQKLLILTDWKGAYSSKFVGARDCHELVDMDTEKISDILSSSFEVMLRKYQNLDLSVSYKGWYVIYASSEERGLFYKGYIEDVLLKLQCDGAILVPDFRYFRAHGNKAFQEILRKQFKNRELRTIHSDIVGRLEELDTAKYEFPVVVKSSTGSGSLGVRLARDEAELRHIAAELSYVRYTDQYFQAYKDIAYSDFGWRIKTAIYKVRKHSQSYRNPSGFFHANKVVIQNFVEGLDSDYKVLYYYRKYYVLHRMNRKEDFRASGSGLFSFPDDADELSPILNYARMAAREIDAPMVSMDIAKGKDDLYLIEFQCLNFGPYTMQYAKWHFVHDKTENVWKKVDGQDDIEEETARAIREYILDKDALRD